MRVAQSNCTMLNSALFKKSCLSILVLSSDTLEELVSEIVLTKSRIDFAAYLHA